MRVGVIADIHGDPQALQRVLAAIDLADADEIWCLGDIVGLGATDPAAVVDLIRDRCSLTLAGNHDRWVTGDLPLDMLPLPRQRAELQWQRRELSHEHLAWLAALPDHARRDDVELWHASAEDPLTLGISTSQDAADHLARQQTAVGLVGHTHRRLLAWTDGTTVEVDKDPNAHDLSVDGRAVLNPGPVRRAHRWLQLDLARRQATWHTA